MLINVNEEQNRRVEQLLDEGIANLRIEQNKSERNIPSLNIKNDNFYRNYNNNSNNNNYNNYLNYNSNFGNINNNYNFNIINNPFKKYNEKYIYYAGRNTDLINNTIEALNTGLPIVDSNNKGIIKEKEIQNKIIEDNKDNSENNINNNLDNDLNNQNNNLINNNKDNKIDNEIKIEINDKTTENDNNKKDIHKNNIITFLNLIFKILD